MPVPSEFHSQAWLILGLLVVQVALGAAFVWLSRGPWRYLSLRGGWNARRTGDFVRQLRDIVAHTESEVGQHHSRVVAARVALDKLRSDGNVPSPEALLSLLEDTVGANEELCRELATAKRRLEEQSRRIEHHVSEARTDALTGLPNRRALDDELERRVALPRDPVKPLCLVLLDADNFKIVNDQYGHPAGDAALRHLAERICTATRKIDFVARYGGEEFAVIFPSIDPADALDAAERVRRGVAENIVRYQEHEFRLTLSAGLTTLQPGDTLTSLVRRADAALYASKRGGRDCLHYHDGQDLRRAEPRPRPASTTAWSGKERRARDDSGSASDGSTAQTTAAEHELRELCSELVDRLQEVTQPVGDRPPREPAAARR